jgi:hypothetical protein
MSAQTMDEFLRDERDAILVGAQARLRGDETMTVIAAQREISENDLSSQVLGFWLEAIRSDLTLGSTAAMVQNMQWLVGFRAGHKLPFDDAMVPRMFGDVSDEIEARLDSEELRAEYASYRAKAGQLIADAFPA